MSVNPSSFPASLEASFIRKMKRLAIKIVEECRKSASSPLSYPDVLRSLPLNPSFQSYILGIAKNMTTSVTSYANKAWWFRRRRVAQSNKRRGEELLFHVQAADIFSGLLNEMGLNGMDEFLSDRIKENAALFSSVPFEIAENLAGWAAQRALQGGTADRVAKEMEGMVLGATKAKFTLIARTEMSKTKSAVTEFKSLRLKVPAYIWKASGGGRGDGRTRHSHKGMADVIVFWDDAPAPEDLFPMKTKDGRPYRNTLGHYHCGCCPNCRCTPMPLVFAEDLKFPVRVYTNGKIIRMNQRSFDRLYREKSGKLEKPLPRVNEEKPRVSLVSDEMTSEELSRKAKEQKRDDKGQFSKEGNTGQKNQEERKEPEEQKEDIFYIDQQKEIENCKALYSANELQKFEDKKKKRINERIQYEKYWRELNLEDTVRQFLPNAIRESVNKNGKIYYTNDSNIIIDYDVFGDYFRIFDKKLFEQNKRHGYFMIVGDSLISKDDIWNNKNYSIQEKKTLISKFLVNSHYKRI